MSKNVFEEKEKSLYAAAGVDVEQVGSALKAMLPYFIETFDNSAGEVVLGPGYPAAVIDIGQGIGLAISTDSVGTKILVAQIMDKYDTVGIDCVAMNVNDVICVGAEPRSMLNYIACEEADEKFLEQVAIGLAKGAYQARVAIPGGEIAQVREMLRGERANRAFDLVGMAIGVVPIDKIIIGQNIKLGDVIIGFASSGIHSNGFTLARKIFFNDLAWSGNHYVPELGRAIGEELLQPTYIYVKLVMAMIKQGIHIKAAAHHSGDGLLNLRRVKAEFGSVITWLPEPHPIFKLIQKYGNVPTEEMYIDYNMGIGFSVVVPEHETQKVIEIAKHFRIESWQIGHVEPDPERQIRIDRPGLRLVSEGKRFVEG